MCLALKKIIVYFSSPPSHPPKKNPKHTSVLWCVLMYLETCCLGLWPAGISRPEWSALGNLVWLRRSVQSGHARTPAPCTRTQRRNKRTRTQQCMCAFVCVCYLMERAHVGLVMWVRAEQKGPEQRLRVRSQLGQDARHQQVDGNGVFQKVFQPWQQDADEGACGIMGGCRLVTMTWESVSITHVHNSWGVKVMNLGITEWIYSLNCGSCKMDVPNVYKQIITDR